MPLRGVRVNGRLAADGRDIHDALALDDLRRDFGGYYDIGYADGAYYAFWLFGGKPLVAESVEGIGAAIRADAARRTIR